MGAIRTMSGPCSRRAGRVVVALFARHVVHPAAAGGLTFRASSFPWLAGHVSAGAAPARVSVALVDQPSSWEAWPRSSSAGSPDRRGPAAASPRGRRWRWGAVGFRAERAPSTRSGTSNLSYGLLVGVGDVGRSTCSLRPTRRAGLVRHAYGGWRWPSCLSGFNLGWLTAGPLRPRG